MPSNPILADHSPNIAIYEKCFLGDCVADEFFTRIVFPRVSFSFLVIPQGSIFQFLFLLSKFAPELWVFEDLMEDVGVMKTPAAISVVSSENGNFYSYSLTYGAVAVLPWLLFQSSSIEVNKK